MLKLVNYTEFLGNELHLMPYRTGGLKDKITGNIFVKNLPAATKSGDLHALFSQFGPIFSCRVKYASSGICRGYGYVQFESKESADKALAASHTFKEVRLEVESFKQRASRNSSISMYNNLYVKCLPKDMTSKQLLELFQPHGKIASAVVIKDREDMPENKGFGFVCFETPEMAKVAEEKMNNFPIGDQKLYVARAYSKEERKKQRREEHLRLYRDCNLYVRELPDGVNDELFKKAFEEFGRVISARVFLKKEQVQGSDQVRLISSHVGFVCFSSKEEALKAITAAHNREILGTRLYVAIAESKEERHAKNSHRFYMPRPQMPYYSMPPPMYPQQYGRPVRTRYVYSPVQPCRTTDGG